MKLAEAYGALGIRVTKEEEVDAAIKLALETNDRPVVIDFVVSAGRDGVADGAAGRRQQLRPVRPRSLAGLQRGGLTMSTHVLSLLVEDKPGLLTRVAGLFARRGFNIESLAVGHSEIEGLSRITVVVDVEELPLEQVTKQLNKLINVIKIVELDPDPVGAARAPAHQGARRQHDPLAGARGGQPLPRPRGRRRRPTRS